MTEPRRQLSSTARLRAIFWLITLALLAGVLLFALRP